MHETWWRSRMSLAALSIALASFLGIEVPTAHAEGRASGLYVVGDGTVTLEFDPAALDAAGLRFVVREQGAGDAGGHVDNVITLVVQDSSEMTIDVSDGVARGIAGGSIDTCGAILMTARDAQAVIGNLRVNATDPALMTLADTLGQSSAPSEVFELTLLEVELLRSARDVVLTAEVRVSDRWAAAHDLPELSTRVVGLMVVEVGVASMRDAKAPVRSCGRKGGCYDRAGSVAATGSDVIVADLQGVMRYRAEGDITSYAVATNACNIGTARANWIAGTNQHPVIIMDAYRLKGDRFEQIGQSWVKHGFYAVSQSLCGSCTDATNGTQLGVGCSDPYSAYLNGVQTNMSPRTMVNPQTGEFPFDALTPSWIGPAATTESERRIQIHHDDLDPALNDGARYFIQGFYIHPDDCTAGTDENNASYREVAVFVPSPGIYKLVIRSPNDPPPAACDPAPLFYTQCQQPAIRAWQDADNSVVETDARVPNEGLFILAAKAKELDTGIWRYAYALQNYNSHRSGQAFRVPFPDGAIATNVAFHDVDYHSGEPYAATPWDAVVGGSAITWSGESWITRCYGGDNDQQPCVCPGDPPGDGCIVTDQCPGSAVCDANGLPVGCSKLAVGMCRDQANAHRFDTIYNFSFDANVEPATTKVRIDLYRPGFPKYITAETIGPRMDLIDCNGNTVPDACDLDCGRTECVPPCGQSTDCDANNVPDECEADCNENDVADSCDLANGTSNDCNGNYVPDSCEADCDGDGIPDDCDSVEDTDQDGITDCFDLCPNTTPPNSCVCPPNRCCFFPDNPTQCIVGFTREQCLSFPGARPDCVEPPCNNGCLLGDVDGDGDLDLSDARELQRCHSGSIGGLDYVTPSPVCQALFDFDKDVDIDLFDYQAFHDQSKGP